MWRFVLGFASGFAAGFLVRELRRDSAKAVVHGALSFADGFRDARDRAVEAFDGLVTEVRGERLRPLTAASAASELDEEPLELPLAVTRMASEA